MTPPPSHIHRSAHAFVVLLVVLASTFVALTVAGPAGAATPCGNKVLADWFDNGRIDRLYPLHCYEDAIDAIPDDLTDYSDAEEVISRALQSALRGQLAPGGPDPSPDSTDDPTGSGSGNGDAGGPSDPSGSGDPEALPEVDASGPSSLPIPLLVLGGMSVALLAAGGLGYLSRRRAAAHEDAPGDDELPL